MSDRTPDEVAWDELVSWIVQRRVPSKTGLALEGARAGVYRVP